MKMKKFLGMMLLAGAVAAATSCNKDDDEGGNSIDAVLGSYNVLIDVELAEFGVPIADSIPASLKVEKSGDNLKITGNFSIGGGAMPININIAGLELSSLKTNADKSISFQIAEQSISVMNQSVSVAGTGYDDSDKGNHGKICASCGYGVSAQTLSFAVAGSVAQVGDIIIRVKTANLYAKEPPTAQEADINGAYLGSVTTIIGNPADSVNATPIVVDSVSIAVATSGGKTTLTANVALPIGITLPIAIELTSLTPFQLSVPGVVDIDIIRFKIPEAAPVNVPTGETTTAVFTLEGADAAAVGGMEQLAGYHGYSGVIAVPSGTLNGISAYLQGTVTGMAESSLPVQIIIEAQRR